MNNIEFVKLAEKYESLTFEQVKNVWESSSSSYNYPSGHATAQSLTGFGGPYSCTLCNAVNRNCDLCVYGETDGCLSGKNRKSYDDIDNANTPRKLFNAFRRRAKHMRKSYPELFKSNRDDRE